MVERRSRAAWAVGAAAALLVAAAAPAAAAPPPDKGKPAAQASTLVAVEQGLLQGQVQDGVRTFEGIPYAAAPVGDLRFQPPAPAPDFDGTLDATAPRDQCAQLRRTGNPETYGEDCLYLNVTAPARTSNGTNLPVMVWIHGGSFVYGTGASYDASKLAAEGVVVVTINYRLGPQGFLAHPALSAEQPEVGSGNLALQDQQAALRWVQENAAAFGGNASNVTIFGESAGAAAVCGHLFSPASAGLFDRAIAQSYSCAQPYATQAAAEASGAAFAARVGCTDPATAADCLRSVDSETLLRAWTGGAFVIGGSLLPLQPAEALATDRYNHVKSFMHGNTQDENRLFTRVSFGNTTAANYEARVRLLFGANADAVLARYPLSDYPTALRALETLQSDAGTALSTCTHVRAYDLISAPPQPTRTYAYQFQDRTSSPLIPALGPDQGAAHAQELPYLFPGLFGAPLNAEQQELADAMVEYWTSFAKTGNPRADDAPTWHRYRTGSGVVQALRLSSQGGIGPVDVAEASNCDFFAGLA